MGLIEDIMINWDNKYITYQGHEMFVVKQFEYEGITYLYVVDTEDALKEDKEDLDVAFLYKVKDNIWANVDDDKLFNELLGKIAGELTGDLIRKYLK